MPWEDWLSKRVPGWVKSASAAIGPVAGLAAIVLGAKDIFDLRGPAWATTLAASGSGIVVLAIATVYLQQYRTGRHLGEVWTFHNEQLERLRSEHADELETYRRNAVVAAALPTLHDAEHRLRDAAYSISHGESEDIYMPVIQDSLAHMAMAFSTITGVPCRMCIKELVAVADTPPQVDWGSGGERWFSVQTLCRHLGGENPAHDSPSPLWQNSDFKQLWEPDHTDLGFFSNDLDEVPNYTNPHRVGNPDQYPYNAAIVWPIQKRISPTRVDLIGYVCVDSRQRDVFRYDNDFFLGAAYADSLYTVLNLRRQYLSAQAHSSPPALTSPRSHSE